MKHTVHVVIASGLLAAVGLGCEGAAPSAPMDAATSADRPVGDGAPLDRTATDAAPDAGFSCESLGGLCHEVDPGDGPLHECHEEGHAANPAWCAVNAERCRMLCEAAHRARDAGVDGGDGGHAHGDAAVGDASAASVACTLLGSYCHAVDPGSGPLHDCHEGAHGGDPAWCAANTGRCYELCRVARANDGGVPDGGVDAGASPEAVACRLLGSYCHDVDPGSGPLHDCHDGAHAGDPMWCAANTARCYALCRAARASDAGADAARDGAAAHDGH